MPDRLRFPMRLTYLLPLIRRALLAAAPLVLLLVAPAAEAQLTNPAPSVNIYRYAEPGQATMDVSVWGSVRTPGVYQIRPGTDLLQLLTYAGGPTAASVQSTREERTTYVRLSRVVDGRRVLAYDGLLDDLITAQGPLPELQQDDVLSVEVSVRQRFGWRDGLQIFSSVGTVAVIVLNIIRLSN